MESATALRIIGAFLVIAALSANVIMSHKSGTAPAPRDAVRLSRRFNDLNGLIIASVVLQMAVIDLTAGRPSGIVIFIQAAAIACLLVNTLFVLQPSGRRMLSAMDRLAKGLTVDAKLLRRLWVTRWISFSVNTIAALAIAFSFLF